MLMVYSSLQSLEKGILTEKQPGGEGGEGKINDKTARPRRELNPDSQNRESENGLATTDQ